MTRGNAKNQEGSISNFEECTEANDRAAALSVSPWVSPVIGPFDNSLSALISVAINCMSLLLQNPPTF